MELHDISPDKKIRQANALTSSRFEFSACQLDILFMIMATLEKGDESGKAYPVRVQDIEAITGRKWNYQQVRESTQNMGSQMFEIGHYEDPVYTQLWLFRAVTFYKGKGYFEVKLADEARALLFDLKDNFTVLQLKAALSCTSKYAKRLYTIACQWRIKGEKVFDIGEFKEMLSLKDPKGIKKEQFTQISQFEERVLKIAKKQINEHTDIKFDYKLIKRGRSFTHLKIMVNQPAEIQMEIDFNEPVTLELIQKAREEKERIIEILKKLNLCGGALAQASALDVKVLREANKVTKEAEKNNKIETTKGRYFWGVLKMQGHVKGAGEWNEKK